MFDRKKILIVLSFVWFLFSSHINIASAANGCVCTGSIGLTTGGKIAAFGLISSAQNAQIGAACTQYGGTYDITGYNCTGATINVASVQESACNADGVKSSLLADLALPPAAAGYIDSSGMTCKWSSSSSTNSGGTAVVVDVNACICVTDKVQSCTQVTQAELATKCLAPCTHKAGACSVSVSQDLQDLQKTAAGVLNKTPFTAGGVVGAQQLIAKIINFLIFPIGMFAMVFYIYSGFLWMNGSSEDIEKAKNILTWTTLGIIVTLSAYLFIHVVFSFLL